MLNLNLSCPFCGSNMIPSSYPFRDYSIQCRSDSHIYVINCYIRASDQYIILYSTFNSNTLYIYNSFLPNLSYDIHLLHHLEPLYSKDGTFFISQDSIKKLNNLIIYA